MSLKWSALSIAIVGVVCIVFGVMGIIGAGDSEQEVADELAPVELEIGDVNAAYDQAKAALGQAMQSGDLETIQNATLQKTSLGLAKSNISTIKFVKSTAILEIILGAGLILASVGMFKQD